MLIYATHKSPLHAGALTARIRTLVTVNYFACNFSIRDRIMSRHLYIETRGPPYTDEIWISAWAAVSYQNYSRCKQISAAYERSKYRGLRGRTWLGTPSACIRLAHMSHINVHMFMLFHLFYTWYIPWR